MPSFRNRSPKVAIVPVPLAPGPERTETGEKVDTSGGDNWKWRAGSEKVEDD